MDDEEIQRLERISELLGYAADNINLAPEEDHAKILSARILLIQTELPWMFDLVEKLDKKLITAEKKLARIPASMMLAAQLRVDPEDDARVEALFQERVNKKEIK